MDQKTVLLVDDEESIRELVGFRLEKEGYKVEYAENGAEAFQKARELKPDCMILDVMLPVMDGYKVCQMLKFDDNYWDIPIILLSARSEEEDKLMGQQTGADLYLGKAYSDDFWKELMDSVAELIKRKEKV